VLDFAVLSARAIVCKVPLMTQASCTKATWTVKRDMLHCNSVPLVYRAFGGGTVLAKKGFAKSSLRANVIGWCGQ
jgi:hypothetical protein